MTAYHAVALFCPARESKSSDQNPDAIPRLKYSKDNKGFLMRHTSLAAPVLQTPVEQPDCPRNVVTAEMLPDDCAIASADTSGLPLNAFQMAWGHPE